MRAAGLDIVSVVMSTETVLISNPRSKHKSLIQQLIKRVNGWMTANNYLMVGYNCPKDRLPQAKKITPGFQAPTVMSLAHDGWCAVSALVHRKKVSDVMDQLQEVGCTGIIATLVHNCRFNMDSTYN